MSGSLLGLAVRHCGEYSERRWRARGSISAVVYLVRIQDSDLESFLVSESPVFKRIIRRSRASYKHGGGLTREQLEERLAKTRGA